jgi:putative two-component system response regulator
VQRPSDNPVILIVDDTPENVDVLAGILHEHYQIKIALNGPKALKIAQSDPAPALILLDVMMPEMDGYEVCSQLQADERTQRIPVIFVTAKSEDEAQGFALWRS